MGGEYSDTAVLGVAAMEAEGALRSLGLDPEDASAGLLAALAAEFVAAYRAC